MHFGGIFMTLKKMTLRSGHPVEEMEGEWGLVRPLLTPGIVGQLANMIKSLPPLPDSFILVAESESDSGDEILAADALPVYKRT